MDNALHETEAVHPHYWAWLRSIADIKPSKIRQMLQLAGNPKNIYTLSREDVQIFDFLSVNEKEVLSKCATKQYARSVVESLRKLGIFCIPQDNKQYPKSLWKLHDPPLLLYVRGSLPDLNHKRGIAIIGTRHCSAYGEDTAYKLSLELAKNGMCIISGLALGIDGASHRGALASCQQDATIAVLAGGLEEVYPSEHAKLFEQIVESGAVISENPPSTKVFKWSWPYRNRIIAALSKGLLVVEAPFRSGVKHTVDIALDLGIEVFAVPGRIDELNAQTPNDLISNGAKSVTSAADVLSEFGIVHTKASLSDQKLNVNDCKNNLEETASHKQRSGAKETLILSDDEAKIIVRLGAGASSADELVEACEIPVHVLLRNLTQLMKKNIVKQNDAMTLYLLVDSNY